MSNHQPGGPAHSTVAGSPLLLFSEAFRALFLGAGSYAVVAMSIWVLGLLGWGPVAPLHWHVHEMVFGLGGAAMGGFLLTAIPSWTRRPALRGMPVVLLVLAWLLGRVVMLPETPWAIFTGYLELLYPFALAGVVMREIVAARNRGNYLVVALAVLLALADAGYQLSVSGWFDSDPMLWLRLALYLLLVLLTIVAGRVIPAFTGNWLRMRGTHRLPVRYPLVERLAVPVVALFGVADAFLPGSMAAGLLAGLATGVHGIRLSAWRGIAVRRDPLLLVLHLGYLWIVIGFAMLTVASFSDLVSRSAAIHALTIGAVATMILAIMSRASLGHTGRPLQAPAPVTLAYVLLSVAALLRVAAGVDGSYYVALVTTAGVVWIIAFGLFVVAYAAILSGPRVDSKPAAAGADAPLVKPFR